MNKQKLALEEFNKLKNKYCPTLDIIFSFNNSKTKTGVCYDNPTEIQLSKYFLKSPIATPAKIRDVILHELAHAIVGVHHQHNDIWKNVALEIGCSGQVCSEPFLLKSDYKYIITCPNGCHTRKLSLTKKYLSRPHVCRKHNKLLKIRPIK